MKIRMTALSCLVAFTAWAQTDRISAIGYVVADIDRSETFYTEVLGMRPAGSFSLDATWSQEAGAAGGRPFSVKMFRLGDGPDATLLKLAYFESTTPRPPQEGLDSPAGVNYLTLNYRDLQPVVDRLREAGIPVVGYVRRERYQLLFIRDPDGLFIELVGSPDPPVLPD